jgi:hypothetical protein
MHTTDAEHTASLDAVRNILFGQERRLLETRLQEISERLETVGAQQTAALERAMEQMLGRLNARITEAEQAQLTQKKQFDDNLKTLHTQVESALAARDENIGKVHKESLTHFNEVKQGMQVQAEQFQRIHTETTATLRQEVHTVRERTEVISKEVVGNYVQSDVLAQTLMQMAQTVQKAAAAQHPARPK